MSQDVREVEGQGLGTVVTPTLGAGGGVSETAPKKFEVWTSTWEEFVVEGELVRKVVAEIGPGTLLVALGEMITAKWTGHDFYTESHYEGLLRELRTTGNWEWVKRLEGFKDGLACAEEPIGYVVFWDGDEVVDIIALVLFHEEHYVNLLIYRIGRW